jgi:hypothetical protein
LKEIKNEAETFGYVPRNMFLSGRNFISYESWIVDGVKRSALTVKQVNDVSLSEEIRHRLVTIEPAVNDSTNQIDYRDQGVSHWLGTYVFTLIISSILRNHDKDLRSFYFNNQFDSVLGCDPKLNEIASLGCFALNPTFFKASPLWYNDGSKDKSDAITNVSLNSSNKPSDKSKSKRIESQPLDLNRFNHLRIDGVETAIPCLTDKQMEEFILDVGRIGMAAPRNNYYPGIDGVGHFHLKAVEADGQRQSEEWITAFFQVTASHRHEFSDGSIRLIKKLLPMMDENAKKLKFPNHRVVIFWLGKPETSSLKSPDINISVNLDLGRNIEQYQITSDVNKKSRGDKMEKAN